MIWDFLNVLDEKVPTGIAMWIYRIKHFEMYILTTYPL